MDSETVLWERRRRLVHSKFASATQLDSHVPFTHSAHRLSEAALPSLCRNLDSPVHNYASSFSKTQLSMFYVQWGVKANYNAHN